MKKRIIACVLSILIAGSGAMQMTMQTAFASTAKGAPVESNIGLKAQLAAPEMENAKAVGEKQILVSWKAVDNAAGYYIYRGTSASNLAYYDFVEGASAGSYLDTAANYGTNYTYSVAAYDKSGAVGQRSSTGISMVTYYPGTPKPDAAIAKDKTIKVSWKAAANASGYYVYEKTGNGNWVKKKDVAGANTLTASFTAPANPSSCYYTVRAYNTASGTTYAGNYDKTGIQGTTKVDVPSVTISDAVVSGSEIKVSWKAVSGVTGYEILRRTVSSDWESVKKVSGAATTSYTDNTVKKKILYYYKVRAYITLGGNDYYGADSAEKNVSIGKAPSLKESASAYVGGKTTLKVKNNSKNVSWASEDKSIATISKKGVVTGKQKGSVRVYAEIDGVKYYCTVTVKSAMTTKASSNLTIKKKKTKSIVVTFRLGGKLSYKLDKKGIVSVKFGKWKGDNMTMKIKGQKEGKVKLTLSNSANKEKLTFEITVK